MSKAALAIIEKMIDSLNEDVELFPSRIIAIDALKEARDEIANLPDMGNHITAQVSDGWIEDYYPDKDGLYICSTKSGHVDIYRYESDSDNKWYDDLYEVVGVTAWQERPLPLPPTK